MAKKARIFSYGTGKRKIGHSKFDVGFTNTYSQKFGELNPVALYETLPDDRWNIASDGVTLVKPLAAPAFSDIKQHFYAFHVRNSAVWKHWNDFITNGTAFSGVYGSNASNQSSENPWKIPSINAGYFQDICKIATGYGCLVTRYNVASDSATGFWSWFFQKFTFSGYQSGSVYDVTDAVSLFFAFLINSQKIVDSVVVDGLRNAFLKAELSVNSDTNLRVLNVFFVGCQELCNQLINALSVSSVSTAVPSRDEIIGKTEYSNTSLENEYTVLEFVLFCDDATSICKRSLSPYLPVRFTYRRYDNVFKSYRYEKRFSLSEPSVINNLAIGTDEELTVFAADSNFFGRYYHFTLYQGEVRISSVRTLPTDFGWQVDTPDLSPAYTTGSSLRDYALEVVATVSPYMGVVRKFDDCVTGVYGFSPENSSLVASLFSLPAPVYYQSGSNVNQARSLGYDGFGFLLYLCKNSYRLLDSLNFPVAALATRSYAYYRYQDFNALSLFVNSKIWDKFFRNAVVSSPELDFSCTNGDLFLDYDLRTFLASQAYRPSRLPERYDGVDFSSLQYNSWVIPFQSLPLNGMVIEGATLDTSSFNFVVALSGHHNQLVISSRSDVFSLLTGFGLQEMVVSKMYNLFRETEVDGMSYQTFNELFTRNFYLPSYYNGLCHMKFQNFNKDYFTAAMLDPMSGANDVAIGSTVTENRVAEAKQSWFERIAPQRSVSGFMEAIFGITPVLDEKEPRFLGSHHVPVNIGEVIQTSSTTPTSPQGQRVGIGGSRGDGSLVHGRINEHGWIIVYNSFTVESQYHQGLERQLQPVNSYMDYPTIDFANIGNDSILMKELNFDGVPTSYYRTSSPFAAGYVSDNVIGFGVIDYGTSNPIRVVGMSGSFPYFEDISGWHGTSNVAKLSGGSLDNVFGFIPRYSSYKFKFDQVHGEFTDELDFWHTFRNLHGMPILSHEFVNWELCVDDDEFNRIFAVTTSEEAKFLCETRFNASVSRALPYVCVPHSK